MNEGVKVLIERLKTNPEDFELVQDKNYKHGLKEGRFYWVSEQVRDYLSLGNQHMHLTLLMKEDLDALVDAFKEKHQQEFTDRVMRDLFRGEEDLKVSPQIAGGWLPQGGRVSTALGQQNAQNAVWTDPRLAFQQAQQAQNQQLRALMDSNNIASVSKGGPAECLITCPTLKYPDSLTLICKDCDASCAEC